RHPRPLPRHDGSLLPFLAFPAQELEALETDLRLELEVSYCVPAVYSRERLGLSARELQSLTTVSARLERLPRLRAAFAGGVLNWAQIRLVATVATPEDETEWLARAERRTVRALAAVIRTPPDSEDDDVARFR